MSTNPNTGGKRREGFIKDGTSTRTRMPSGNKRAAMPRIMWLAILICVVGAALLFRNSQQQTSPGLGEQRTVVTAPSQQSHDVPRSGDVDLNEQTRELTPEQPAGQQTTAATSPPQEAAAAATPKVTPTAPAKAVQQPTRSETSQTTPPVVPVTEGPFAVQAGAFGTPENADKEAARLQAAGWDARVRAGNSSAGDMVYRVWICYFPSRAEAGKFIEQNRATIPGAIVVHR